MYQNLTTTFDDAMLKIFNIISDPHVHLPYRLSSEPKTAACFQLRRHNICGKRQGKHKLMLAVFSMIKIRMSHRVAYYFSGLAIITPHITLWALRNPVRTLGLDAFFIAKLCMRHNLVVRFISTPRSYHDLAFPQPPPKRSKPQLNSDW